MKSYVNSNIQQCEFEKVDFENLIYNEEQFFVYKDKWVFLKYAWDHENYIFERCIDFLQIDQCDSSINTNDEEMNEFINQFQNETLTTLNEKQRNAVMMTLHRQGLSILTGLPGTGKSLVIKCIDYIVPKLHKTIKLVAPTGKASNRLGYNASTIHRALEAITDEETGQFKFSKNQNNLIDADVLIIDEFSMVDLVMFKSLLLACSSTTTILLVGDMYQLPSIGYGDILNNLISSGKIPFISLTKVYRQQKGSAISLLSKHIVKGIIPALDVLHDGKETFYYKSQNSYKTFEKVQMLYQKYGNQCIIMTPMRKGQTGSNAINTFIHNKLIISNPINYENPGYLYDRYFLPRERLLVIKNTYSKDDEGNVNPENSVFNGDTGFFDNSGMDKDGDEWVAVDINTGGKDGDQAGFKRAVTLERSSIELGHACTIHKMQGGEHPVVILVMSQTHSRMLNRKLFYTAVTRAKEKLYIVGDDEAIIKGVMTESLPRYSLLSSRLQEFELSNVN
jgi:exodeoxyribonuclease V alpha subunit